MYWADIFDDLHHFTDMTAAAFSVNECHLNYATSPYKRVKPRPLAYTSVLHNLCHSSRHFLVKNDSNRNVRCFNVLLATWYFIGGAW